MTDLPPELVLVAGAGLAGLLLIVVLVGFLRPKQTLSDRAARLKKGHRSTSNKTEPKTNLRRQAPKGGPLEHLAGRLLPRIDDLRQRFERTGLALTPGGYLIACVMAGLVAAFLVGFVGGFPWPLAVLAATVSGAGLPHWGVGLLGRRRIAAFTAQFPDAIDLIVRGLKSGLPVSQCIRSVGEEMPNPVGQEFRAVSDAVALGRDLDEALWETAKRLDTPEFKFFVISLTVQRETGGNLAETLANLADILRKRKQMRLKIKALSSEARASALILALLPLIMFAILFVLNPGYAGQLLTDERGRLMLIGAGCLMTSGIFVMARMIRFEI